MSHNIWRYDERCGDTNTQWRFRSHAKRSEKIRSKNKIFSQKKIFLAYQKHSQCRIIFVNIAASLLSCFSAKQIKINSCESWKSLKTNAGIFFSAHFFSHKLRIFSDCHQSYTLQNESSKWAALPLFNRDEIKKWLSYF